MTLHCTKCKSTRPGLRDPVYATRSTRPGLRDPVYATRSTRPGLRDPVYATRSTRPGLRDPVYATRSTRPGLRDPVYATRSTRPGLPLEACNRQSAWLLSAFGTRHPTSPVFIQLLNQYRKIFRIRSLDLDRLLVHSPEADGLGVQRHPFDQRQLFCVLL